MKLRAEDLIEGGSRALDDAARITDSLTSLRGALDSTLSAPPILHLSGSVANRTNIGVSDLDVTLPISCPDDAVRFETWASWRQEIFNALSRVAIYERCTVENKCIRVTNSDGSTIDILPCLEVGADEVLFWATGRDGRPQPIYSYPALHQKRTEQRDMDTRGSYRHYVRSIKYGKAALVDAGVISHEDAPSYFLECLVHSTEVGASSMPPSPEQFDRLLDQLARSGHETEPTTVSGRSLVFGPELWQWSVKDKDKFVAQLRERLDIGS